MTLPEGSEVHIWQTEFNDTSDEKLFEKKRQWKLQTRDWVNNILNKYSLSDACIYNEESGRPFLAEKSSAARRLPFSISLSHSYQFAAFAISGIGSIGVDIEKAIPRQNFDLLLRYIGVDFNAKQQALPYHFYTLWTNIESLTKALGTSLWDTVSLAEKFYERQNTKQEECIANLNLLERDWTFFNRWNGDRYMLSVCVEGEIGNTSFRLY